MQTATLNMVRLDRWQKAPLQSQIYRQIRQLITTGQLQPGIRLPSTRDLASQLGVSRNTIVYALDHLVAEGYLRSRTGSGFYVEDLPGLYNRFSPVKHKIGNPLSGISERARQFSRLITSPSYLSN